MTLNQNAEVDMSIFNDIADQLQDAPKENLSSVPLIKLLQSMSPEAKDHRTYPNLYPGCIIDSITKECLGTAVTAQDKAALGIEDPKDRVESVIKLYVLLHFRSRVKFPPRSTGINTIECSCMYTIPGQDDYGSKYGACKTCKFSEFGRPDACRQQGTVVFALADDPTKMYRVILSKTSYKAYRSLVDGIMASLKTCAKLDNGKALPPFVIPVYLYAKEEENKSHDTYNVFNVVVGSGIDPALNAEKVRILQERYTTAKELYAESLDKAKAMSEASRERNTTIVDEVPEQPGTSQEARSALDEAFGSYVSPGSDETIPF